MTSKSVAQLLVDLDVARSHSRPHVSNDNPYSAARGLFTTEMANRLHISPTRSKTISNRSSTRLASVAASNSSAKSSSTTTGADICDIHRQRMFRPTNAEPVRPFDSRRRHDGDGMTELPHVAQRSSWHAAQARREYRMSTRGLSVDVSRLDHKNRRRR